MLLIAACAAGISPLSLDVRYAADAPRAPGVDLLSGLRVGVARFVDQRPRRIDDLHSASFVAHDSEYHVGLSWGGRTFAPVARVAQGLLLRELRRAGLNADGIDAVLAPDNPRAARAAGEQDHFDVVLAGRITDLQYNTADGGPQPSVSLDVAAFEVEGGTQLFRATFSEHHAGAADSAQARIDDLLENSFKPVAHQLVARLGVQLGVYLAAATRAEEAAASPAPVAQTTEAAPEPSTPPAHHKRHR